MPGGLSECGSCADAPPVVLRDAGIRQLQQDFSRALHDVQEVGSLVALPDQVLPVAEGALRQSRLQNLQQMVLHKCMGVALGNQDRQFMGGWMTTEVMVNQTKLQGCRLVHAGQETHLAGDVQDIRGGHEVGQLHQLRIELAHVIVSFCAAAHLAQRQQRPRAPLGHPWVPHHLGQRNAIPWALQMQTSPISAAKLPLAPMAAPGTPA